MSILLKLLRNFPLLIFTIGLITRSGGASLSFIRPMLFVVIGVLTCIIKYRKDLIILNKAKSSILLILIFVLYLFLSTIYTNAPNYGLEKAILLSFWILVFVIMAPIIISRFDVFLYSVFFSQIVLLIAFYYYFGSPLNLINNVSTFSRLGDEDSNPITIARILGFCSILSLYLMLKSSNTHLKLAIMLILSVSFVYMFFSGSKGPLISLIFAILFYFFIYSKISLKAIPVLLIISLTIYTLIENLNSNLLDFIEYRFTNSESSFSSREDRISSAIDGFFNNEISVFNLLFGFGLGDFAYYYNGKDILSFPHNLIIEIIFELGIVGFILFLYVFIFPCLKGEKFYKSNKILYCIILYTFLNSMVSADISYNFLFFCFVILLIYRSKYKYMSIL